VANKKSDEQVKKIVNDYQSSWNYRDSSYHNEWENWYKLYNSERVAVGYNGISDTFVPMAFSTIETKVSATSGSKPQVEYFPTRPDQATNTEVLNGLFSFYWDLDNWTSKFIQHTRNLFLYGTGVMYVYWDIDQPRVKNIPLRDFFCDPTATILTYQDAAYMGYRFFANKADLEEEMVVNPDYDEMDPTSKELVPKFKNLDKLDENYDTGEESDKQEKDDFMGSTLDDNGQSGQIEVICYWTKDKVCYVGNKKEIIYEEENYYKTRQQFLGYPNPKGMYPFIVDSNYPDESLLYGRSELQPIFKAQELLNDITNQNIDAVSWSLDPVMELDPQYSDYIDKISNVTGAIYPFKPGSYQAVQKPLIPSSAFNERVNIKNEIRETTAVEQVIKGAAVSGDTTATEIKAQVASAGRRFDALLSALESGGYYTFAKLVFQMIQMYVNQPTMLRVLGETGVSWETYDPEQFQGDYEPRIKLQATLQNEKAKKMRDYKEMYTAMLGSPFVNQKNLTELIMKEAFELDGDKVQKLIVSDEELAQMGDKKEDDQNPKMLINYKDAPPDVKMQMEMDAGFEPSESHMEQYEADNLMRGADEAEALGRARSSMLGDVNGQNGAF